MVRRTKEEALATRHSILDAAELLFEKRGVSRTSLQDIAEAAGVTRGAIYWHFQGKEDLFTAMMERATMPMEAVYRPYDEAADGDPLAFMERQVMSVLKVAASNRQMRRALDIATHKVEYVDELLAVRDRRVECRSECLAEGERVLKVAIRRGLVDARTPTRALAIGLHALVDGLIQNWMLRPTAFDLVKVGRQAVKRYVDGMRVKTSPLRRRQAAAERRHEAAVHA